MADPGVGLAEYIVLTAGELEARRTWTAVDGREKTYAWRVAVNADGPGFALLGASGSRIGVRALADAEYLTVNASELDDLLGWRDLGQGRLLAKHPKVFHRMPLERVREVFARMTEREVAAGQTIVTQREHGDSYFIIVTGEAEVWVTDPMTDETRCVAVLRDDDAFGEEALLLGGSRTATVTMSSPGRLLVLNKADFDALLKPTMVDEVDAARAHELLASGRARLLDCRYPIE